METLTCTQSSQHECAGRPREPHGPAASAAGAPSHSQARAPGQQLPPPGFVCALIRPAPPPAPALPPAAPLPTARLYGELPGGSGAMRGGRRRRSARGQCPWQPAGSSFGSAGGCEERPRSSVLRPAVPSVCGRCAPSEAPLLLPHCAPPRPSKGLMGTAHRM